MRRLKRTSLQEQLSLFLHKDMNKDKIKILESFIKELNVEVNDLCIYCRDYYEDDALSSYDSDSIEEPDSDEFGGDNYRYLTKAGAQSACKRAVKRVFSYVSREYEKTMKAALSEMKEYFSEEMPDYLENVQDFIEVFSDYLESCVVEDFALEDELKDLILKKRDVYFAELLDWEKMQCEMRTELDRRVNWALSAFKPVIPDDKALLDEMNASCDYDYDEDDKRYCFDIDEACDIASEHIEELIEGKAENLFNAAAAACLDLIESYADKVKAALLALYTDIVENETGQKLTDEEIDQFREENLELPFYDDCIEELSEEPKSKTFIVYPWELLK